MNNQSQYYQYQQNLQILKDFFSKPLTLICGIIAAVATVLGLFSIASSGLSFAISGSILTTLVSIALILLYIRSHSASASSFGPSVVLIKIHSIFGIVISGIALFGLLGITSLLLAFSPDVVKYLLLFYAIVLPLLLLAFLMSLGELLWICSVKRSSTSVYLSSTGSLLAAVTFIITAIINIAAMLILPVFFSTVLPQVFSALQSYGYSADINAVYDTLNTFYSTSFNSVIISTVASSAVSVLYYGSFAALTISYHIHIKKCTNGINLGDAPQEMYDSSFIPPVNSVPAQSIPEQNSPQPFVQQPIDFQPQSVDFGTPKEDNTPVKQFENPYLQAMAEDTSDADALNACPNCHTKCSPDMKFCSNCGTKLK